MHLQHHDDIHLLHANKQALGKLTETNSSINGKYCYGKVVLVIANLKNNTNMKYLYQIVGLWMGQC